MKYVIICDYVIHDEKCDNISKMQHLSVKNLDEEKSIFCDFSFLMLLKQKHCYEM